MLKRRFTNPVVLILLGIVLGVSSKYGDIAYANSFFSYFGLLTSGLLFWLVLCTVIIYATDSKKQAIIKIVCLMLPMLVAYYLYSYFIVKYLSIKVALFWSAMLIVSLLITNFIWQIRFQKAFRTLFIIASVLAIVYDAIIINGVQFAIIIPEIIFAVAELIYINKSINKNIKGSINESSYI
ncbi:MAG: hypothetical protein J1E81_03015 [Eubacterium sp.]|nr:hypothetical protein [Eubacterium sp.]